MNSQFKNNINTKKITQNINNITRHSRCNSFESSTSISSTSPSSSFSSLTPSPTPISITTTNIKNDCTLNHPTHSIISKFHSIHNHSFSHQILKNEQKSAETHHKIQQKNTKTILKNAHKNKNNRKKKYPIKERPKYYLHRKLWEIAPVFNQLKFDDISIYSITENNIAHETTKMIKYLYSKFNKNTNIYILDGMACIGLGNIYSFIKIFYCEKKEKNTYFLFANELNFKRYEMLKYNLQILVNNNILNLKQSKNSLKCWNCNINELHMHRTFRTLSSKMNVIFLDPEWGGNKYKLQLTLKLKIGELSLEDAVCLMFARYSNCTLIAVKLPLNYNFMYFKKYVVRRCARNGSNCCIFKIVFCNQALIACCRIKGGNSFIFSEMKNGFFKKYDIILL